MRFSSAATGCSCAAAAAASTAAPVAPAPAPAAPASGCRVPRRCPTRRRRTRRRNPRPGRPAWRELDCRARVAQLVDQAQALGVGAGPDAALRDGVDRRHVLLARVGDHADEALVLVFDVLLHHVARLLAHRPHRLNSPDRAVVPTPSKCTPTRSSERWKVGNIARMPIEPVSVAGLATIRSASSRCSSRRTRRAYSSRPRPACLPP